MQHLKFTWGVFPLELSARKYKLKINICLHVKLKVLDLYRNCQYAFMW